MVKVKVLIIDKNSSLSGKILNVKSGYARNYLIPFKKAVYASSDNINKYKNDNYKDNFNYKSYKIDKLYKKIISLSPLILKFRCDDNNKLFCSIKNIDIKNIFYDKLNIKISKKCIIFPNGPIKYLGNYIIKIFLYKKNIFNFNIIIKKLNV